MSAAPRRCEAGFTLMEMLVGAGIMVAVGAVCFGGQLRRHEHHERVRQPSARSRSRPSSP
jgi:Tfp pilus assembly protein FimT